jgi:hypothetical protein
MHAAPAVPDRLHALFFEEGPEHQYLRSLCTEILSRPAGVPLSGIPYSIDFGRVNSSPAALEYIRQANAGNRPWDEVRKPSELIEDARYSGYFTKPKSTTVNTGLLALAPWVLDYLLGRADALSHVQASKGHGKPMDIQLLT